MSEDHDKSSELIAKFNEAYYAWFTTVRRDSLPQPTPVWFIPENGTYLIFSMPQVQKVKNIQHNPKVALSYAPDPDGEAYYVVMGEAVIDPSVPPLTQVAAYLDKYASGIQRLGWTPESMAADFTVAIRVTPSRVRGQFE